MTRAVFIFGGIRPVGSCMGSSSHLDPRFMAFRTLSSVANTVFQTLLYLRLRRLIPFAVAHALMDGTGVLVAVILPQLMP